MTIENIFNNLEKLMQFIIINIKNGETLINTTVEQLEMKFTSYLRDTMNIIVPIKPLCVFDNQKIFLRLQAVDEKQDFRINELDLSFKL